MGMGSRRSWKKRPSSKMFKKLFRYISGGNQGQESIDMTIPVLSKMTPVENPFGTISMTKDMCFYLGSTHQDNPPAPLDPKVNIVESEEMTVFVHRFGGYT